MQSMSMAGVPPLSVDKRPFRMGAPGCPDNQRSPDEVRVIQDMMAEEIDDFLNKQNFDGAAARALKNETPYVVLTVLERGPFRDCTNPSGALVARIRDAKQRSLQNSLGSGPGIQLDAQSSELDRFLADNRIDQSGIAALRRETPDVQQAVLAKGPMVNTTNTSASLMARIRVAKDDIKMGGTGMGSGPPRAPFGGPMGGTAPAVAPGLFGAPNYGPGANPGGAPGGQQVAEPTDGNLQSAALKAIQQLQMQQNAL